MPFIIRDSIGNSKGQISNNLAAKIMINSTGFYEKNRNGVSHFKVTVDFSVNQTEIMIYIKAGDYIRNIVDDMLPAAYGKY